MNSDTVAPIPGTPAASGYGARVIAVVSLLFALVEAGFAALCWVDAAQSTDDELFGSLGYYLAAIIGVPAVIAIVAAAVSLTLQRHLSAASLTAGASALAAFTPFLLFAVILA
ncbi:hypothetical protein [Nocardioides ultimimeridianus]